MEIIARAEDPASEAKLRRGGATQVVLPARIGGERMANLITRPGAEEMLARSDLSAGLQVELEQIGLRMEELSLPLSSSMIGRPLADIEVHGNRGFPIIGIRRASGEVQVNPIGETPLRAGDPVIVMGHPDDLPELRRRYAFERQLTYRGARVTR